MWLVFHMLLEDIFEDKLVEDHRFSKNDYVDENEVITELNSSVRDTEYCLQPLVLKKNDNGYSVIDGQQRLTTLYIIMKALCSVSDKKFPVKFSIEYKSRAKSKEFLQTLSDESKSSNIDAAYILQAYCFAKNFIEVSFLLISNSIFFILFGIFSPFVFSYLHIPKNSFFIFKVECFRDSIFSSSYPLLY